MRSRSPRTRAAAVAAIVVATLCARPALADDPAAFASAQEPASFSDRIGWAFTMGYGHGFNMRARTQGLDVTETRMLLFMPHVRVELFDLAERQRWWAGALDFVLEPELAINFAPEDTGVGGGASAGLRYRFRPGKQWQPYALGVVGIGGIDYDLASQADGFAFWLQFALGMKRQLGERTALTGDVRLYHISNAGLTPPNAGIDMIAFTLGIETP